jgi:hypothetical protein
VTPVRALLEQLQGVQETRNGWSARCPAHDDQRASLSVAEGDGGRALVKCHAGCTVEAVTAALGLTVRDLMPERDRPAPNRNGKPKSDPKTFPTADAAVADLERQHGKRSDWWAYHDSAGNPVGVVVRWDQPDGKEIRPVSRHGDGWRIGAMPDPRPLYALPDLAAATRVIVTEGEKAADAARSLGFTATTSAGGAQAPGKTDWQPLAGKEVWILPDHDPSGRKYADTVASLLAKLTPAPVVKVVELPDLPVKGDIVDWIDAHGDAAEPDSLRAEIEALAKAVEPEAPDPPANDAQRFQPFPVDALPQPIRGFVAAGAKAIGCDPSYLALPLLVALAAAIGNTRRLELKRGWSVPAILWGAIVGESGTAKTPAFRLVLKPAREREQKAQARRDEEMKRYEAELARWEKDYAAWKRSKDTTEEPPAKPDAPPAERHIVSDTTVEALAPILMANPRGLLLARDELAGWIGSFDRYAGKGQASADEACWLSMFNAESITIDRKTGMSKTIHVPQAAVCVTGGIPPGSLRRALGAEHRESGLAARLLLAYPPRRAKRWTEADIDPRAEADLAQLFDRLYELRPAAGDAGPGPARLTLDAKEAWKAYYDTHADEQADLDGDLAAAWSKLEEYAARLALVVHFVRWAANDPTLTNADTLDAASMGAGITLAKWFKGEARRVYAMLGESEGDRAQRRLAEWIERNGGSVTIRQVRQGCRWLKEPGAAEMALEQLARAGRGAWRDKPAPAKGGRPSRVFALSTPSTSTKPPIRLELEGFVDVDAGGAAETRPATPARPPSGFDNPAGLTGGRLFPDCHGLPD